MGTYDLFRGNAEELWDEGLDTVRAEKTIERLADLLREVHSSDDGWALWGDDIEDLFQELGLEL